MPPRKRKPGRPPRGKAAGQPVTIRLTKLELAAIEVAVREQGPPATVSSWIRDHALEPLKDGRGFGP